MSLTLKTTNLPQIIVQFHNVLSLFKGTSDIILNDSQMLGEIVRIKQISKKEGKKYSHNLDQKRSSHLYEEL